MGLASSSRLSDKVRRQDTINLLVHRNRHEITRIVLFFCTDYRHVVTSGESPSNSVRTFKDSCPHSSKIHHVNGSLTSCLERRNAKVDQKLLVTAIINEGNDGKKNHNYKVIYLSAT